MLAIREAVRTTGYERLSGCRMYVTLEPCSMCAGAIVLARIDELIYGASDPKTGACGSLYDIVEDERLNHRVHVRRGMMEQTCSQMIRDFFAALRQTRVRRRKEGLPKRRP
jgi:tRNA(adenine34) deaminase